MNEFDTSVSLARRAGAWAASLMLLTTIHHVYGAVIYRTPWRAHVAIPALLTTLVIGGAVTIARRRSGTGLGRAALWIAAAAIASFPVALIGGFEGAYNHVLKDALYFGGVPMEVLRGLFPAPAYEMPNDVLFEVSGMLQVVPALLAAHPLGRLLRRLVRTLVVGVERPAER